MPEWTVTDLPAEAFARLAERASAHGWSVADEARHILTQGVDVLDELAALEPVEPIPIPSAPSPAFQRLEAARERVRARRAAAGLQGADEMGLTPEGGAGTP